VAAAEMAQLPGILRQSGCAVILFSVMTSRASFPCPKCKHSKSIVKNTGNDDSGLTRQRQCLSCGYQFFTFQEPEYLLGRNTHIKWGTGKPIAFNGELPIPDPIFNRNSDGSITIWIGDVKGTVSSDHLTEPKLHQLQQAWLQKHNS